MITEKIFFDLHQIDDELTYLEKKDTMILVGFDGEQYAFEENDTPMQYDVHFSVEPWEVSDEAKALGYEGLFVYEGSRGGYYTFLARPVSEKERFNDDEERKTAVQLKKNRLDRFTLVVIAGVLGLYGYFFLKSSNPVYFIILLPAFVMAWYTFKLKKGYNEFINK